MEAPVQQGTDWKILFSQKSFRYLFAAIFISLFGSGLNFAGVNWYVLEQTQSTVQVSLVVILATLPGLVVPTLGGVLIDRVDRRFLGIGLDLARGGIVLATAGLLQFGPGDSGVLYAMMPLLGVGFAVYWSTTNALVQEVVPAGHLVAANAAVLIAVQGGMMTAGTIVGFVYEHVGIAGILAVDGGTYLASAFCLIRMRRGYSAPPQASGLSPATEPPPRVAPSLVEVFLADLLEGLRYLSAQSRVLALGLAYACMMAGVISSNVLVVALARDVLQAGPRGYGYIEAGWAIGAITGGFAAGVLVRRFKSFLLLVVSLATLAVGHALLPYVGYLAVAAILMAVFAICRAVAGVLTQSSIMSIVPRRLMGRTQSAFSLISTLLQVGMSFSLGWLAQRVNLPLAFAVLGLLYGTAVVAALRVLALMRPLPATGSEISGG